MTLLLIVLTAWSVLGFAAGWWTGYVAGTADGRHRERTAQSLARRLERDHGPRSASPREVW